MGWSVSAQLLTLAVMASTSAARLDEMIEEATVDCYNDSEQVCGLFTLLDEALAVPFETTVLGATVTVESIELTFDDQIMAVCVHGDTRQLVRILDLTLPNPPPDGAEWIDAYRRWAKHTGT